MNVKRINKFIKGKLVKRIREDAGSYRILNERDLESLVYHELRKKLDKYEDVKISTNFTVTGTSWKRKSGGAGKFIQADIVILESRDKSHIPKMHVAIELKARTPGKATAQGAVAYRTLFRSRTLQQDFKKLNKLKEDNLIEIYEDKLVVKESARMFVRNVCMAFDLRLADAKPEGKIFSMTI